MKAVFALTITIVQLTVHCATSLITICRMASLESRILLLRSRRHFVDHSLSAE